MTPVSTVSAILDHARRSPEQPWLFFRPELDWRWYSWRQVAAQVASGPVAAGGSADLGAAALGSGGAVVYPSYAHPDVLGFDLAVSAAGLAPAPLAPQLWPPSRALLETVGAVALGRLGHGLLGLPKRAADPAGATLPRLQPASPPGPFERSAPVAPPAVPPGAVWLSTAGDPRCVSQPELCAAVEASFGSLPTPERRDVVVVGRCLAEPFERLLVSWAALTGAALILEPEAARALPVETIRWVRPTLLHGTAAELCELQTRLLPRFRRSRLVGRWLGPLRPPFDRVRAVVVLGPEPLETEAMALWRAAGARLLHLPEEPFGAPREAAGSGAPVV